MIFFRKLYYTYGFWKLYRMKLVTKSEFSEFKRELWQGK